MKKRISAYALQILLSFAFICLPYVFNSGGEIIRIPDFSNGHDRTYFGIYVLLLAFFFLNYYVLIPRLYFHEKRVLYVVLIVMALMVLLWFAKFIDRPMHEIVGDKTMMPADNDAQWIGHRHMEHRPVGPHRKPLQEQHTILVYIIGVLTTLFFSINQRLRATQQEKIAAELLLLKAQINPHFLFNTLNSIYALSIRNDERTSESIVQLAELMRYIMNNATDDQIDLSKEVDYIGNYISLQKSRLEETATVRYSFTGNPIGKKITPLILISFIENAFKHGVNPEQNSEIDIAISVEGQQLTLRVFNLKVQSVQHETGLGLRNTIERLELLYPERHLLQITDLPESYAIKLTMLL